MPQQQRQVERLVMESFTSPDRTVAALKEFIGEIAGTPAPDTLQLVVLEDFDHYIELVGETLLSGT